MIRNRSTPLSSTTCSGLRDLVAGVVFLDSSVLFNLLDVPAKNSDRSEVIARFQRLARGVVVETA